MEQSPQPSSQPQESATPILSTNKELATSGSTLPQVPAEENKLALLDRFLDIQGQELKLREREANLEENNQQRSYDYSCQMLAAQERDRVHGREHNRKTAREKMIGVIVLLVVVFGTALTSIYMGNKDFALDLLKYVATFTAGGAFGYGAKTISDNKKKDSDS